MHPRLNALKNRYFDFSMIRWALVGLTTTLIDYLLFISLYYTTKTVFISNLISASVATTINYLTHHRWTFRSKQNHSKSGFKYILNIFSWWVISTSIIKALVDLGIDPRVAKLAPLIVIVPINYFILNLIVFRKKSQ
jgi:putative flippase GtrA